MEENLGVLQKNMRGRSAATEHAASRRPAMVMLVRAIVAMTGRRPPADAKQRRSAKPRHDSRVGSGPGFGSAPEQPKRWQSRRRCMPTPCPQGRRAPAPSQPLINQTVARAAPWDSFSMMGCQRDKIKAGCGCFRARTCAHRATHVMCGHVGSPDDGKCQIRESVAGRPAPGAVGGTTSVEPEKTQATGARTRR